MITDYSKLAVQAYTNGFFKLARRVTTSEHASVPSRLVLSAGRSPNKLLYIY